MLVRYRGEVFTRSPPGTLRSIQAARGIAALMVVAFHLSGAIAAPKYFGEPWFQKVFLWGGHAGVDFFFVLSGFIISMVHLRDIGHPDRLPEYLYKRFTRIYPIYWIIFCVVALPALLTSSNGTAGLPKDPGVLLMNLALIPQDPAVAGGTGASVLVVAWSLQYEIVFYFLFALWILGHRIAIASVASVAAGVLASHVLGGRFPFDFLRLEFFALFVMGIAVASALPQDPPQDLQQNSQQDWRIEIATFALVLGSVGFVATAALVSLEWIADPVLITLAFGVFASLLIFGLAARERRGGHREWKLGLKLGDASYVLYLIHYPVISVACKSAIFIGLTGMAGASLAWVLIFCVCIAAALAVHSAVERPIMNAARRAWGELQPAKAD